MCITLWHHLRQFPDWWISSVNISGNPSSSSVSTARKLWCGSVFQCVCVCLASEYLYQPSFLTIISLATPILWWDFFSCVLQNCVEFRRLGNKPLLFYQPQRRVKGARWAFPWCGAVGRKGDTGDLGANMESLRCWESKGTILFLLILFITFADPIFIADNIPSFVSNINSL